MTNELRHRTLHTELRLFVHVLLLENVGKLVELSGSNSLGTSQGHGSWVQNTSQVAAERVASCIPRLYV